MVTQIGLIGLGKMGFPLAQNMIANGFEVYTHDLLPGLLERAREAGLKAYKDTDALLAQLSGRKVLWLMIPAGPAVDHAIEKLLPQLQPGDILIDGGNSYFEDSVRRYRYLAERQIDFLDCGTSGGVGGARHGVCTMIGGKPEVFAYCEKLFQTISVPDGYLYTGEAGSGHYVKMIHNGIEYGMMQAIGEGFEMLHKSRYELDLKAVANVWNHGSVIRSWLIELAGNALSKDPHLSGLRGIVNASGEGQWTVETALREGISIPVITLSLLMRYRSQEGDTFSGKLLAALRREFGGHQVQVKEEGKG